jgi:hypothetical protein
VEAVMLAIDGLQAEKGHATLYVVRELECKRVWFAEPLLSSATTEVQQLLVQARVWTERLGKRVRLWISDKQDAFVRGIEAEFPGVPHRYGAHHFLRDIAKPVLESDSRAKVQMRRTVRGVRALEREVMSARRSTALPGLSSAPLEERRDTLEHVEEPQDTAVRGRRPPRMSCWMIAPRSVASCTTIKAGPCTHPVSVWARLWGRCRPRSSAIWRRKKGGY